MKAIETRGRMNRNPSFARNLRGSARIVALGVALLLAGCRSAAPATAAPILPLPAESERSGEDDPVTADSPTQAQESDRSFAGTNPAPEFPVGLDWLNTARPLTLAELKGKIVLLDFWTYGCINCMHNFPGLKQLEAEYPDELVVIGVHSAKFQNEGETENIRQIILRYDLEHAVVNDNQFLVWNTWGARAWPTLVLIDPRGNVVGGHSGEGVYPIFKPVIDSLVSEFDQLGLLDRTSLELRLEKEGLPSTVLAFPGKVLADPDRGRLFVADTNHHRIIVADLTTGEIEAVYGTGQSGFQDGPAEASQFRYPQGMALTDDGEGLFVADVDNHAIRQIDLTGGQVSTLVGTGIQAGQYPPASGLAAEVELSSPWDVVLRGDELFIAMAGSHQIWRMNLTTGEAEAYAGSGREGTQDGPVAGAELAQPSGLTVGPDDRLYFADSEGSSIRWVELTGNSPAVGTLAGSGLSLFDFGDLDGVGGQARLQHPLGISSDGIYLYVADTYNSKIKRIDPASGEVVSMLGSEQGWRDGRDPRFYEPGGLHFAGGRLYVADTNNHSIRVVDLTGGETTTLVLSGIEVFSGSQPGALGTLVDLPPVEIGVGTGTVVLEIQLPAGYKINDLAPSSVAWEVEGSSVRLAADSNRSAKGLEFPIELAADFSEGRGALIADLTLYYCEADKQTLCLIDQARLRLPLSVVKDAEPVARLHYEIPTPAIKSG